MKTHLSSRRQFLQTSALVAGTAMLSPWSVSRSLAQTKPTVRRTAVDQVTLGKTGIKLSRLGIGTGSANGHQQTAAGKEGFTRLIRHAYDQGITYIDTAERYATFEWIGTAIKDLPREKLFIQSKVPGRPEDVLGAVDKHRKMFNTDYIDSLLIHCMTDGNWTDDWKRVMDGFNEAKEKKWIRSKGVSCHSLQALQSATATDWTEVHLVRVNPEGHRMDNSEAAVWGSPRGDVPKVMEEIKTMHAKGHGVIGMKIFGNGDFKDPAQRDRSLKFAMGCKDIDGIVIGFTSTSQVDEAIERMNRALAEV
jgi:1-deoxyxylulose-5-phosphate synthase